MRRTGRLRLLRAHPRLTGLVVAVALAVATVVVVARYSAEPDRSPRTVRPALADSGTTARISFSYGRAQRYRGTPALRLGRPQTYFASREQPQGTYGLDGRLQVEREYVQAVGAHAQIVLSYQAAKVDAVLGHAKSAKTRPGAAQPSVRVTSPGRAPRRILVGPRPGVVRLVDEPTPRRTVVTLTLSPGVRAYAVGFG